MSEQSRGQQSKIYKEIEAIKLNQYADHYHKLGFNVTAIKKGKAPYHKWKYLEKERQQEAQVKRLRWQQCSGIGAITGVNNIRAFDFDKIENFDFLPDFLQKLGLPTNYPWTVLSGSGKGVHIWVRCTAQPEIKAKQVYTYKALDARLFDHVELRWNQHTNLPPSLHESKMRYKFAYQFPIEAPAEVSQANVMEALSSYALLAIPQEVRQPKTRDLTDSQRLKEDIRQRIDLVGYAVRALGGEPCEQRDKRIKLEGDNLGGFFIYPEQNTWYWHTLGRGGDIYSLIAYQLFGEGFDTKQADQFKAVMKEAKNIAGISDEQYQELEKKYTKKLKNNEDRLKEDLRRMLPEGVNVEDAYRYGFYEYQHAYYFQEKSSVFVKMSNFSMRVLYLIKSKTNPKRIVELTNEIGAKTLIEVTIEEFVSLTRFNVITQSQGNYLFEGKDQHLMKLKRKLLNEEKPSKEIGVLGWQKEGFFAWANGLFNGSFSETDDYGIVKHQSKYYFIPALSKINEDDDGLHDNDRKFKYQKGDVEFAEWADMFQKVYKESDNGIIGIIYYCAALFRDISYRRLFFFPILNLFGVPGAGKNTMSLSMMALFGEPQTPFALGGVSTAVGFMRKFAQYRNALIWLDEYKNSVDRKIVESLKNIYDGTGYTRGVKSNDNKTHTSPIHSACLLSGQELPTADPALFKRCITLTFELREDRSKEEVDSFKALTRWQELGGLPRITCQLLQFRDKVEKEYDRVFDETLDEFGLDLQGKNVEDRILKNMVCLVTIYNILKAEIAFPFDYPTLKQITQDFVISQSKQIKSSSDVQRFWDIVQYLAEADMIKEDYDYKRHNQDKSLLYIRLSKIYPLYMEAHKRQYETRGMGKTSLVSYLESSKAFKRHTKSTRFKDTNTSAMIFNVNMLSVNLLKVDEMDYRMEKEKEEEDEWRLPV